MIRRILPILLIIALLAIPVSGTTITRTWNQSDPSPLLSAAMDENYHVITPDYNNTEPWRSMGRVVIDGQTMVQVKKHYIKTENITTADGFHWMNFSISDVPATGFSTDPWHVVNGTEVPWVYISAFEGSVQFANGTYNTGDFSGVNVTTDKLVSVTGAKPTSGKNNTITLPGFRTLAHNRGIGWELQSFSGVSVIGRMYLIEYGTWNSQTTIGPGITQITDDGISNMAMPTGLTAGVGANSTNLINATGQITTVHYSTGQLTYPNSYRGVENFYGNIWKWVDGLNIKGNNMPWIADHDFASDLFAHPYVDTGRTLPASNGYVSNLAYASGFDWAFLPSAVAGSSSTYLCDYYFQNTGNRAALFGGYWSNGANAGTFFWNLLNAASNVYRYVGARVAYTPPIVANYTYTNTSANFTFTDESFTISTLTGLEGTPTSWNWSFGDGSLSTLQNPTHTFMAGTTNTVNLTVSDGTNYATSLQTITVGGIHSSFTPTGPITTWYPTGTLFTDTSTGSPTTWDWKYKLNDAGAGTTFNTTQNATFFPPAVGNYTISLNASSSTSYNISTQVTWVNVTALTVSITSSSNPALTGSSIDFTSIIPDGPTTFDWGWGDGTANATTANASHTYSLPGTYGVFFNASNVYGSFASTTLSQVVANASGLNQQDLSLDPQFTLTMHITDSSTGAPIPVVTVTDSNGQSYTTTNGTAYFTEPYSTVVFYLSATGYTSKAVSYIIDEDRTVTVQMAPATTSDVQQQVYPHYVTFHLKEGFGTPIEDVEVAALGVSTSTGNWDWIVQLLGLPLDEVPINGTYMNQTTDSLGRATFYMIPTGKYNVSFTKSGYTITPMVVVPQDTDYVIWATSSEEAYFREGVDELSAVNITITTTAYNESYAFINLTYSDSTGGTTGGEIRVLQKSDTPWTSNTVMATWPVLGSSFTNSTGILHVQQVSGYIDANITHSTFGYVTRSYPYSFNSIPVQFLGFGQDIALLVALGMMCFTLMLAGAAHVRPILFIVCIEGWIFDAMHWFDSLVARGVPHTSLWFALSIATIMAVLANFEVRKKKEKY